MSTSALCCHEQHSGHASLLWGPGNSGEALPLSISISKEEAFISGSQTAGFSVCFKKQNRKRMNCLETGQVSNPPYFFITICGEFCLGLMTIHIYAPVCFLKSHVHSNLQLLRVKPPSMERHHPCFTTTVFEVFF